MPVVRTIGEGWGTSYFAFFGILPLVMARCGYGPRALLVYNVTSGPAMPLRPSGRDANSGGCFVSAGRRLNRKPIDGLESQRWVFARENGACCGPTTTPVGVQSRRAPVTAGRWLRTPCRTWQRTTRGEGRKGSTVACTPSVVGAGSDLVSGDPRHGDALKSPRHESPATASAQRWPRGMRPEGLFSCPSFRNCLWYD